MRRGFVEHGFVECDGQNQARIRPTSHQDFIRFSSRQPWVEIFMRGGVDPNSCQSPSTFLSIAKFRCRRSVVPNREALTSVFQLLVGAELCSMRLCQLQINRTKRYIRPLSLPQSPHHPAAHPSLATSHSALTSSSNNH